MTLRMAARFRCGHENLNKNIAVICQVNRNRRVEEARRFLIYFRRAELEAKVFPGKQLNLERERPLTLEARTPSPAM